MDGTSAEREAQYTLHLRTQGIEPSSLALAEDGTMLTPSARARVVDERVEVKQPPVPLGEADVSAELGVLRTLGVGGMGKVLLAIQRPLQREVAVKMPRNADVNGTLTAELLREALVTGRLEHPNIVPVHTLGRAQNGAPFFVMKRIEGTPWRLLLDDAAALAKVGRRAEDPLGFHLGVLLEVCNAVSFAHSRGVLHRDLKPDNVMLGSFGEVYVLDWGIAVTTQADPLLSLASDSHGICGTPSYMAPEMAGGDGTKLSERTDVYLLGAVLHHIITGKPPHRGTTVVAVLTEAWEAKPPVFASTVPDELGAICRRAMARSPEDRYASVQELRDALEGFLRRRDSLALAAEAERRLVTLETSLAQKRARTLEPGLEAARRDDGGLEAARSDDGGLKATGDDDLQGPLAMQVAFTECRFAFQQVRAVPGLETVAKAGLSRALVAMARGEVLDENLPAARALISQLEAVPPELAAEVEALAQKLAGQKARVAALEHLEEETDLNRAVSLRSRVALAVSLVCSAAMFGIALLKRAGVMPFGFREAVVGMSLFGVALALMEVLIRQRSKLNEAQRRLLRGNRVALTSFIVFWSGAWALGLTFEAAAVVFMFCVAVNWWIATVLYDRRAWPVAATFSAAAPMAALLTGWQFEIFAAATLVGFGGLALAWRARPSPQPSPRFAGGGSSAQQ